MPATGPALSQVPGDHDRGAEEGEDADRPDSGGDDDRGDHDHQADHPVEKKRAPVCRRGGDPTGQPHLVDRAGRKQGGTSPAPFRIEMNQR
jgi:hypothetical protein